MNVKIFRQRISRVHESETEINDWLEEDEGSIEVKYIEEPAYMTDNTDNAQPGYIVSAWYTET